MVRRISLLSAGGILLSMTQITGCSYNLVGTWRIERMSIGNQQIKDAGILDIQQDGAESSDAPVQFLVRYFYLEESQEFVPDPTPLTEQVSFDFIAYSEADEAELMLNIPGDEDAQLVYEATFLVGRPEAAGLTITDPDFTLGPLEWVLIR